jgi:hypothetical protein
MVQSIIWGDPEKYRPGSKSNNRFLLETNFHKVSADPNQYPDEWRLKLDTRREWRREEESGKMVIHDEWVTAEIRDIEGQKIEPSVVQRNGYIVPVIQASYARDNEKFGLVLTMIQGLYTPPEDKEEEGWEMDFSEGS